MIKNSAPKIVQSNTTIPKESPVSSWLNKNSNRSTASNSVQKLSSVNKSSVSTIPTSISSEETLVVEITASTFPEVEGLISNIVQAAEEKPGIDISIATFPIKKDVEPYIPEVENSEPSNKVF